MSSKLRVWSEADDSLDAATVCLSTWDITRASNEEGHNPRSPDFRPRERTKFEVRQLANWLPLPPPWIALLVEAMRNGDLRDEDFLHAAAAMAAIHARNQSTPPEWAWSHVKTDFAP